MRKRYCASPEENGEVRTRVVDVFRVLWKWCFLAEGNFMCCGGCAGYDLAIRATELKDKGIEVKGAVFWHHPDESHFNRTGHLYLAYSSLGTGKYGNIGLPDVEIGRILEQELESAGLAVVWNGTIDERIEVIGIAASR